MHSYQTTDTFKSPSAEKKKLSKLENILKPNKEICSKFHSVITIPFAFKSHIRTLKMMTPLTWFNSMAGNCRDFQDRGLYHIKTRPLICSANKCTGFYMIGTLVIKRINTTTKCSEKSTFLTPWYKHAQEMLVFQRILRTYWMYYLRFVQSPIATILWTVLLDKMTTFLHIG